MHARQGQRSSDLVLEETTVKFLGQSSVSRADTAGGAGHGATNDKGIGIKEALVAASRHTIRPAGKSVYSMASTPGTNFRHANAGGDGQSKRSTKPSRKLRESRESTSGVSGEVSKGTRGRHYPC